jgi:crotonobetainyl-CoA:carnitine CoA-transferase CaiB-like acyl-CoA transferase
MNPMDRLGPLLGLPPEYCANGMNVTEDPEPIFDAIAEACARYSTEELLTRLLAHDIWCAPVQDYDAVENDPQVAHNRMISSYQHPTAGEIRVLAPPVTFSDGDTPIRRPAPRLGEHSRVVLRDFAGLDEARIEALLATGVVREPAP